MNCTDINPIRNRRIALIGGAGFIGHHLALALASRGAEVSVIDSLHVNNLTSFSADDPPTPHRDRSLKMIHQRLDLMHRAGVSLHVLDARETPALGELITRLHPQIIIHLAGIAHAERANSDPHHAFENSLRTLQYTLDTARDNIEHLIYFSSSMVYGNFDTGTVTEESPCLPIGVYGALKYAGEKIINAHHQVFGVPYTIVRPSALYGERCVSRRVVQVFIENALENCDLGVTGAGSDRLDFTYIDDLVAGVLCIINSPASRNEIFNLTFGGSRRVLELAEMIRGRFPNLTIKNKPRPKLMPARGTLCIEKARHLIGYTPEFSLETGLDRYLSWYTSLNLLEPVKNELTAALVEC